MCPSRKKEKRWKPYYVSGLFTIILVNSSEQETCVSNKWQQKLQILRVSLVAPGSLFSEKDWRDSWFLASGTGSKPWMGNCCLGIVLRLSGEQGSTEHLGAPTTHPSPLTGGTVAWVPEWHHCHWPVSYAISLGGLFSQRTSDDHKSAVTGKQTTPCVHTSLCFPHFCLSTAFYSHLLIPQP